MNENMSTNKNRVLLITLKETNTSASGDTALYINGNFIETKCFLAQLTSEKEISGIM